MADGDERRYPRNLQGVLQMSVAAQEGQGSQGQDGGGANPAFQAMDEDRRQWLNEALTNLVTDEIKLMKEHCNILAAENKEDDEKENALEGLTDLCENLDLAKDFHKIGGYEILPSVLSDENSEIRWRAADFTATLVQNNPYCQDAAMQKGLLKALLRLLDTDTVNTVRIKALYAISCLCREYDPGLEAFVADDGFSYLMRAMQTNVDKLQTKAAFLLQALSTQRPSSKDVLCDIGMVEQLIGLLQKEHNLVHEHFMSALLNMARDHPRSIKECRREELGLESLLHERIRFLNGKEEFLEEKDYASQLLGMCFNSQPGGQELER